MDRGKENQNQIGLGQILLIFIPRWHCFRKQQAYALSFWMYTCAIRWDSGKSWLLRHLRLISCRARQPANYIGLSYWDCKNDDVFSKVHLCSTCFSLHIQHDLRLLFENTCNNYVSNYVYIEKISCSITKYSNHDDILCNI